MAATIRWAFWNVAYLFRWRWRRESLGQFFKRYGRTRNPWRKFKPVTHHNDAMKEWTIYLTNEASYTRTRYMLPVDIHISDKTGEIVGFDVWDENLKIKE